MKKKNLTNLIRGGLTVLISVLIIFSVVKAGSITPPSGTPTAKFYTLSEIYEFITNNTTATEGGHDFNFSDSLTGTSHTLTEIYNELAGLISADQVKSGTTYLGVDGTLTSGPDYSEQSLVEKDDLAAGDYTGEESTWTNSCPVASGNCSEDVYRDGRTGLYWSSSQGTADNNNFTISTCSFFSTEPRGDYDGLDSDCGDDPDPYNLNAINMCGLLSIDSNDDGVDETDWYLPSEKELQQAFIDGMCNQAGSTFTTEQLFWSCTENSGVSTYAWYVALCEGITTVLNDKTADRVYVRCVRR